MWVAVCLALAVAGCGEEGIYRTEATGASGGTPGTGGAGERGGDASGGSPVAPVCAAGRQVTCPCVGGGEGVQVCSADGSGWSACQCPDPTGSAGSDGSAGSAGVAGDAGGALPNPCESGESVPYRCPGGIFGYECWEEGVLSAPICPAPETGGAAGAAGSPAAAVMEDPGGAAGEGGAEETGGVATGGTDTGGSTPTGGTGGTGTGGVAGTECPMPGNTCSIIDGGTYVGTRCGHVPVSGCGYAQCSGCYPGEYCSTDNWCKRYDEGCEPLSAMPDGSYGVFLPVPGEPYTAEYTCEFLICDARPPIEEDPATGERIDRCPVHSVEYGTYWCREDLCHEWPEG